MIISCKWRLSPACLHGRGRITGQVSGARYSLPMTQAEKGLFRKMVQYDNESAKTFDRLAAVADRLGLNIALASCLSVNQIGRGTVAICN